MASDDPEKEPERAAADTMKSTSYRPDTVDHGSVEEQEVGQFEGEGQHGWSPDVQAGDKAADDPEDSDSTT